MIENFLEYFKNPRVIVTESARESEFNLTISTIAHQLGKKYGMWRTFFDEMKIVRVVDKLPSDDDEPPRHKPINNQITIVEPSIQTMAVDASGNIFINENFALSLPFQQALAVVCHEILHVVMMHMLRLGGRNPRLWNFATDYVINWELAQMGLHLPEQALHAEPQTGEVKIKRVDDSGATTQDNILTKPVFILDEDGRLRSAEEIYALLSDAWPEDDGSDGGSSTGPSQPGSGQSSGSGSGQPGSGSDVSKDTHTTQEVEAGAGIQQGHDKHIYGNGGKKAIEKTGQEANNKTREDWNGIINDAQIINTNKPGGNMGGKYNVQMGSAVADWKKILKDYISGTVKTKRSYTRLKKRSYGVQYAMPKTISNNRTLTDVLIAVDTSGSTYGYQPLFMAEIDSIARQFNIPLRVLMWDGEVGYDLTVTKLRWTDNENPGNIIKQGEQFNVSGGGGTRIGCVHEYIADNKLDPRLIVYFTDGFVENNPTYYQHPNTKHLFFLTPDGDAKLLLPGSKVVKVVKSV